MISPYHTVCIKHSLFRMERSSTSIQARGLFYPSDFTEDKREIFVSGELFADWQKDPDKAFIISAGDVHVQVLGTKFNLRAYENIETVEVALVEGSVLFKTPTHPNEILKKEK